MLADLVIALGGLNAARLLHESLISALLRAPAMLHVVVPSGSWLSRFTDDLLDLDLVLHFSLRSVINLLGQAFQTVGLLIVSLPWMLLAFVVTAAVYVPVQVYFCEFCIFCSNVEAS